MDYQVFDLLKPAFEKYLNQTAVIFENEEITYCELGNRVDALAAKLKVVIPQEKLVGISCDRSIQTIINLLAVLSAGKTYIPIDFNLPNQRLLSVVDQADLRFFLPGAPHEDYEGLGLRSVLSSQGTALGNPIVSEHAYVLFTSGSTGVPKGVCMPHEALINLIKWQELNSESREGGITLQFAKLTFDVSFQEICSTLSTGGTLVLVPEPTLRDSYALLNYIIEKNINRLFLPFIALNGLVNTANTYRIFPSSLQEIMTAGEQLKINDSLREFFSMLPGCKFYNQYGPTETHVITQLHLQGDPNIWDELPTIGKSIDNTKVILVDEEGKIISEPGITGELFLSGVCLADGYLNKKGLTDEKFVMFAQEDQLVTRVYKSGDVGCWTSDGEIKFLGRKDDQVKINGFRVELGEIELAASKIEGISECAVVTGQLQDGQLYLWLFYTVGNTPVYQGQVRKKLTEVLPDYMVPYKFTCLDVFPKTSSGKIDRKNLCGLVDSSEQDLKKSQNPPRIGLETDLASIWSIVLSYEAFSRDDNFFELGGSSILAQKLSLAIKEKLDVHFPVHFIYQYPSIKAQAEYLSKKHNTILKPDYTTSISESKGDKDVAVIAVSGKFPGADSALEFWEMIKEEREGITRFTDQQLDPLLHAFLPDPSYVKARGIINDVQSFDAQFFGMNPKLAAAMDPQQRLFLEISYEALEKAGWIATKPDFKIGVFAGTNNNTYFSKNLIFDKELTDVFGAIQVMTLNEKDYIASRTAYHLDLKGPAVSVYSACSTSLLAVAQAVESIRGGKCVAALAGGSSVTFPVNSGQRYEEGSIFSKDGTSRPFDAQASGTVFSDGAGVVLLKDYAQAKADGDQILAVIKGVGVNNDGSDKASFSAPSMLGQAGAISAALKDAQVNPWQIGYLETHGTATPIGDPIEFAALQYAYGSELPVKSCSIGSVKSNIGHLTAASGVAGLIKTIFSLQEKILPASLGYTSPNPLIDFENSPFYVQAETQSWASEHKRIAGISSFGIGGTNVHVILEEYVPETSAQIEQSGSTYLAYYSAKSEASLNKYAAKLSEYIDRYPVSPEELCSTLHKRYHNYGFNHVFTFADFNELRQKIDRAISGKYRITKSLGYFDYPVFMFPGQGAQYAGMGKHFYQEHEVFRKEFEICCEGFDKYLPIKLKSVIFENPEGVLSDTRYTQPALFTMSYAVSKMLQSMGIAPAALCGHSIGEYVAAHLSGVFSLEDTIYLIAMRGKLISELPEGYMLSVNAQVDLIRSILPEKLSVAAVNGPDLCVVAGDKKTVLDFQENLKKYDIASHLLTTSHAFHSHMMEDVLESFYQIANSVKRNSLQIPIMSTQTGLWLTDAEAQSADYWTNQIKNEVKFHDSFNSLTLDLPQAYFIEVGPGTVLSTLALHCKNGDNHPIASSLSKKASENELVYLNEQVGLLIAKGADLKLKTQSENSRTIQEFPTYAFDKKYCWNQNGSKLNPEFSTYKSSSMSEPTQNPSFSEKDKTKERMVNKIYLRQLLSILEGASGIELTENDLHTTFFELGLDSLVLTQLAFSLQKEFGVGISFKQLNNSYDTPAAVLAFISTQLSDDTVHAVPVKHAEVPVQSTNSQDSIRVLQQQLEVLTQQFANLAKDGLLTSSTPVTQHILKEVDGESTEEIKPFGVIARIEKKSNVLSSVSKQFLNSFQAEYNAKTKRSKQFAQDHRRKMADPRVVTGFKPAIKEIVYPIVTDKSKGAYLHDIDGNQYVDWLNGFGSNIFGHSPEFIVKAVKNQLDEGYELGPQHVLSGEVAGMICKITGNERVAFCNTGSEAVLGAIRIARTVSDKPYIVYFTGSYHGIVDEALVRTIKSGKTFPAAPGILTENVQQIITLEYGSMHALQVIKERAGEIAGVLVEPVQSRRPEFIPMEFLKELRNLTLEENICLIFDEVITGFRVFPGGVQEGFGIQADLATYGKVVGGGMPIGVIGGKSHWMDALDGGFWQYGDDSVPPSGVTYFAGTFVRHPLALAAAKATLNKLLIQGPAFQERLSTLTSDLVLGLNEVFERFNAPYYAVNYRSLWKIKTKEEFPYWELLFTLLRNEGIHIWENFPCFVTDAHTQENIAFTIAKVEKVLTLLIENELVVGDLLDLEESLMDIHNPPFKGAIIGLDEDGNPCWIPGA
ncbi:aminotransferase class III-fold pyridoxal phosphate-dependent enzyme [Algoriphagus sp.]|uniref:aminotransferase class III-fold pyridoxal phosphate-dependent enzyme n=1 Tax=Algoriphagus sp. TaxID=1872435 RepID=UPI003F7202B1